MARTLLWNLPGLLGLAIVFAFSTDLELLRPLKTEHTFGLWVVVGVPLAVLLLLFQAWLWMHRLGRGRGTDRG